MPQIYDVDVREPPAEPTGVQEFFSKLGKVYKERQDQDFIGKIIQDVEKNDYSAKSIQKGIFDVAKGNLSPSKRLEAMNALKGQQEQVLEERKLVNMQAKELLAEKEKEKKEKLELEKANKAEAKIKSDREAVISENEIQLTNAGYPPEEVKRLAPLMSTSGVRALVKPGKTVHGPKEKFEEGLATQASKEVPELEKEIKKSDDLIANVDAAEKLANKELGGPIGYGKALFNTQSASNLETLGATNLGSVIKLFNPAGTLPTAKLNWIKKTFAVSPWDTLSTMKGKFDTQRIILNQAKARAQERVGLLKQYYGNIPEDVADKFDKDTGDLLDALEEELEPKQKKDAHAGMVQVPDPKGELRWVPKEVAEQMKRKK